MKSPSQPVPPSNGPSSSNSSGSGKPKGYDHFTALAPGEKRDRISIAGSTKVFTELHRKRVRFIEEIQRLIPEHLELYGRGGRSMGDKSDALLPCKYHLAIENGTGPDIWTEKLADPLLCWAYPFYAGCTNVEDYLPKGSFSYIDLDRPERAARRMTERIQSGLWERAPTDLSEARRRVLDRFNLSFLLAELTRRVLASQTRPDEKGPTILRFERSPWPEKGARGGLADCCLVNAAMLFDSQIELRSSGIRRALETRRSIRRQRRLEALDELRHSKTR